MRWQNKDIPDQAILTYIENSERMRSKVAKLLASRGGSSCSLTTEQRKARASKAGKASAAKRAKNKEKT